MEFNIIIGFYNHTTEAELYGYSMKCKAKGVSPLSNGSFFFVSFFFV